MSTRINDTTHATDTGPTKPKSKRKLLFGGAGLILVTIGFALGSAGGGSSTAAAPAAPSAPVVVTETMQAPPVTVQAPAPAPVTVTAAPAPAAAPAAPAAAAKGPADPKANDKFLLGSQIESGTWQCATAKTIGTGSNEMDMAYWEVASQANDIVDNGNDTIAVVGDEGYTVTLSGCATTWDKA